MTILTYEISSLYISEGITGMSTAKDMASSIYEDIRAGILDLTLVPGSPISEGELCERYEASRTPVRTALHRLADQNLIELLPYQQSIVSYIDLKAVKDFIYARVAIETNVIRDFIRLDDPLLVEDVSHLVRKQEIILEEDSFSPQDFYELDSGMHRLWFDAVKKSALWRLFSSSTDYTRIRILDIKEDKDYRSIVDDHLELLEVIRKKDFAMIDPIVERHLNGGLKRIEARMDERLAAYFK